MQLPFKKLTSVAAGSEKVSDFDFKKHYPDVNQNMAWANIEPYVRQAVSSYVLPFLGKKLYDDIVAKATATTLPTDAAQLELIERLKDVAAYYAVMHTLPKKKTIIASMGAVENVATEGTTGSSLWGFKTTLWSVAQDADRLMDELLAFLEKQAEATSGYFVDNWKTEPAYTSASTRFFRNTAQFQEFQNINRSLRTFMALRAIIEECADRHILPLLCRDQFDALISAISAKNETTEQKKLLALVRKSLAKWATYQASIEMPILAERDGFRVIGNVDAVDARAYSSEVITSAIQGIREGAERSAKTATADLAAFLRENGDDYPLWKASMCNPVNGQTGCEIWSAGAGGVFI